MTDHAPAGRFIVFEGIDGSGKTTQLQRLAEWLPNSGLMPSGALLHVTREPGGTALGQSLRQLLLHPPDGTAPCPTAELLLYAADRAQHIETVIRPALEAGDWVLCDRFTGSTAAYQGYGRGLSPGVIAELERIADALEGVAGVGEPPPTGIQQDEAAQSTAPDQLHTRIGKGWIHGAVPFLAADHRVKVYDPTIATGWELRDASLVTHEDLWAPLDVDSSPLFKELPLRRSRPQS